MASSSSDFCRSGEVTEDASVFNTSEQKPITLATGGVTEETNVTELEVKPVDEADSVTHYGISYEDLDSDSVLIKKGKALIISNNFYGCKGERKGNAVDKDKLIGLCERIGVQTTVIEDTPNLKYLSKEEVLNALTYWSKNLGGILDDADCFILFIMSHGGRHEISKEEYISFANDEKLELSTIIEMFANNRCKAMCGKPKLIFIQSCNGRKEDLSTILTRPRIISTDSDQHVEVANMAEFLIATSSYKGYKSFLTSTGSWFIQSLVDVFERGIPEKKELQQMMIEVNRKVAKESYRRPSVGEVGTGYIIKQVPCTTATLTKNVYFQFSGNEC